MDDHLQFIDEEIWDNFVDDIIKVNGLVVRSGFLGIKQW